jgi:adenosine deaminase CECR1
VILLALALALLASASGSSAGNGKPGTPTGKAVLRNVDLTWKVRAASASSGLTTRERAALVLKRDRARFLARYAADPDRPFTTSFMAFRRELHSSALFRAIRGMPKGGLLHVHATGIGDAEWLIRRALTQPGTYIYWGPASDTWARGQLGVYPDGGAPEGFVAVTDLDRTVSHLSRRLVRLYTIGPEDDARPDIWTEFEAIFQRLDAFVSYRPVFIAYYRHSFLALASDGVQFVEIHTGVDPLTTRDGGTVSDLDVLAAYRCALAGVRARYPSFGLRIILATWRGATLEQAGAQLERERRLSTAAPDIVHGFDIVGQEDTGSGNAFFAPVLTSLPRVPLYLHAGESLEASDTNVEAALDLGAKRIGHGLNMDLFAGLEQRVRDAGVTVEVCPLSNQALRYVPDLRRHPAKGWLRRGTRVALGSDDPGLFGTRGLSDDFAMAYLSWHLGLGKLKQMALRSIAASTLPRERRERQRALFERRWRTWVAAVAAEGTGAATASSRSR